AARERDRDGVEARQLSDRGSDLLADDVGVGVVAEADDGQGSVGELGSVDAGEGSLLARERDGVERGAECGELLEARIVERRDGEDVRVRLRGEKTDRG